MEYSFLNSINYFLIDDLGPLFCLLGWFIIDDIIANLVPYYIV